MKVGSALNQFTTREAVEDMKDKAIKLLDAQLTETNNSIRRLEGQLDGVQRALDNKRSQKEALEEARASILTIDA